MLHNYNCLYIVIKLRVFGMFTKNPRRYIPTFHAWWVSWARMNIFSCYIHINDYTLVPNHIGFVALFLINKMRGKVHFFIIF